VTESVQASNDTGPREQHTETSNKEDPEEDPDSSNGSDSSADAREEGMTANHNNTEHGPEESGSGSQGVLTPPSSVCEALSICNLPITSNLHLGNRDLYVNTSAQRPIVRFQFYLRPQTWLTYHHSGLSKVTPPPTNKGMHLTLDVSSLMA
jgi:hypothetical protein